jgi:hypothetical protein
MHGAWNFLSIKYLFTPNGLRLSELYPFYSGATICQKLISDCTSLNGFAISPCTGLQIHWSWMYWNWHLMDLMIFNFSSLNMSDQVLNIDENSDVCFWGSVTVMHKFAIPLGMTSILLIYVQCPAWLVKLRISPTIFFFKVTSLTEHKASPRFTNHIAIKRIHNHNLWQSKLWLVVA